MAWVQEASARVRPARREAEGCAEDLFEGVSLKLPFDLEVCQKGERLGFAPARDGLGGVMSGQITAPAQISCL